jgi:hypothetical protein
VYAWGDNSKGRIGSGYDENQLIPIKSIDFSEEKVKMISCGLEHSMALMKIGCVFSWGYNRYEQLGIDILYYSQTHTRLELYIALNKISGGLSRSLLLSNNGVIYAFGNNFCGKILYENRINEEDHNGKYHDIRFIDIASHFNEKMSIESSFDNICYLLTDSRQNTRSFLKSENKFNTFNGIFSHCFEYSLEVSNELIDLFNKNGYFDCNFNEMVKLGKGSQGQVFKVHLKKNPNDFYAIKKFSFKKSVVKDIEDKSKILIKLHKFSEAHTLLDQYVANHYEAWLEDERKDDIIILYIGMELCDKTLEELIDEIKVNKFMKINETLTSIGFNIGSQLFIEILECV